MSVIPLILINLVVLLGESVPDPLPSFPLHPDTISGQQRDNTTQILQAQHVSPHPHILTCLFTLGHH
jgi:hypothetical protein